MKKRKSSIQNSDFIVKAEGDFSPYRFSFY